MITMDKNTERIAREYKLTAVFAINTPPEI